MEDGWAAGILRKGKDIYGDDFMNLLETQAINVAGNFSRKYRTARKPQGKECIIIYGGREEERVAFSDLVRASLPAGIDAYVFEQAKKIDVYDRGERSEAFYVDFAERCLDGKGNQRHNCRGSNS